MGDCSCSHMENHHYEDRGFWDYPDMYNDVKLFHEKFDACIGEKPVIPPPEVCDLRRTLIAEEFREVHRALLSENLPEIAKELCDLIYVVLGTAISYGINLNPIWEEVQKTNMLKVGGKNRSDGKVLKPEGWRSPDITMLIRQQKGEV
jgi:predicted HAD superfamily Cof-like phosphohydrolase